ncbi:hypothetical protein AB0M43_11875 [Longispora sp. NPDC051575]|uniref:hypothetical protein n=1 Tax=Longispora sp. NPDC051575 TaxID=3154943 RepID=UPI003424E4FC
MSSKRQRKSRHAKRRYASKRQPASHLGLTWSPEIPVAEAASRLARYVRAASSDAEAAKNARTDLRAEIDNVARLACGLDVIKAVSAARVAMIMERSLTGADQAVASLELIALALVCRDSASGSGDVMTEVDSSRFLPPALEAAAQEALAVGSMIVLFDTPRSDPDSKMLVYSVQREIYLRNPVYPHMLLDTLRGLFGSAAVNHDCQAVLGFTGLEAVNVMEAVWVFSVAELGQRFKRMLDARDASVPFIEAWDETQPQSEEARAAAWEVYEAVQDLTSNIDQATVIDADAVAQRTGYGRATVDAVLDVFTLVGLTDVDETFERFFRGDNPLRTAPIVADPQGRRMVVHEALTLPAIREVIETRLKAAGRMIAYEEHRGEWVENDALDLLASVFPSAQVYRAFNYYIPDPAATTPQTSPEKFTKRVEGDGLIIIDDVALIIEVKSVALTAEARGGIVRRLRGKLRDIITAAANQAERLRERIITDGRIRLDDGKWIDVSGVRETHTIAVGLEDLSGVTTATTMLIAAGLLQSDNIPWTVSVHDLRIVTELLDRPSELLLYLRRRTQAEATWKYRAVDELDLFLHFLTRGLYVEPDPNKLAASAPWSGPPTTADLRRFAAQGPEMIRSYTEPLDAWYEAQLDSKGELVEKPKLAADQRLLDLVDMVIKTKESGWLATATSLLEGDGRVQKTFGRHAADIAKHVRRDRQRHSVTHLMAEVSGKHVLLVWVCHGLDESADNAASSLVDYLQAKKHQARAHRAACMLFDPTGTKLLRLLYDNRPIGTDPVLDKAVANLVPLEKMKRASSRPIRPV